MYLENAHMCASKGIVGPISDLLHLAEFNDFTALIDDPEFEEGSRRRMGDLKSPSQQSMIHRVGVNEHEVVSNNLKENLFFFTEHDYFKSPRFEYLSPAEQTKGFVFGLFVQDQNGSNDMLSPVMLAQLAQLN